MKIILFSILIVISISLKASNWVMFDEYSLSSEKFGKIEEWRISNDEIQIYKEGTSYFYNERSFKLLDKIKVQNDIFIYPKVYAYDTTKSFLNIIDNKFDKKQLILNEFTLNVLNEKLGDTLSSINLNNYCKIPIVSSDQSLYLLDMYRIFSMGDSLVIFCNHDHTEWGYHSWNFIPSTHIHTYDIKIDSIVSEQHFDRIYGYPYKIDNNQGDSSNIVFIANSLLFKYSPKGIKLNTISTNSKNPTSGGFLNKNMSYIIYYQNDILTKRDLHNWDSLYVDTNIRNYHADLILEVKPNILLFKSDSIGYFIYSLDNQNFSTIDKVNKLDSLFKMRNIKFNSDNSNLYAETKDSNIIRINLASFLNNFISVDFTSDKYMADSNYVFNFKSKISDELDSVIWDFGDGIISNELNPKHQYKRSGDYNVNLVGFKNGVKITKNKYKYIHIPTPVRFNITYSLTINENDAKFYVNNGVTGSGYINNYIYDNIEIEPLFEDTLYGSTYSLNTRKAFTEINFIFYSYNDMYHASTHFRLTGPQFDFWNKDLKENILIHNLPKKDANVANSHYLIERVDGLPFIVKEFNNDRIFIKNINNVTDTFCIFSKKIILNSNSSFVTNDFMIYSFHNEFLKNYIDSVLVYDKISVDTIIFADNLDENHYIFSDNINYYVTDLYGNYINSFPALKDSILAVKKVNEYLFVINSEKNGDNNKIFLSRYDKDNKLIESYRIYNIDLKENLKNINANVENDTLLIIFDYTTNFKIFKQKLSSNTQKTNSLSYETKNANVFNSKIFTFGNLDLSLYDKNLQNLYNYKIEEKIGNFYSSIKIDNKIYIYGLMLSDPESGSYNEIFAILDLKDKLTLNIKYSDISNSTLFPNPTSHYLNFYSNKDINEVVIYDLLGQIVLHHVINGNKIDVSNLTNGIYFIKINNGVTQKLIKG